MHTEIRRLLDVLLEVSDRCYNDVDAVRDAVDEFQRELSSLLAASPAPAERPPDTYHWGEKMSQYATLGIGAEAWVELEDIEKRGIAQRNNRKSGMSISWGTFGLVMRVLRAIRLEDFRARAASPAPAVSERIFNHARKAITDTHYILHGQFGHSGGGIRNCPHEDCRWSVAVSPAPEEVHPGLFAAQRSNSIFSPAVAQDERRQQEVPVGAGVHTLCHAIDLLRWWADDAGDDPDVLEHITQSLECAGELAQFEPDEAQAFLARCLELGATDTDIVKHALEDQARLRTELSPMSIALEHAKFALIEARRTIGVDHPVREHIVAALEEIAAL